MADAEWINADLREQALEYMIEAYNSELASQDYSDPLVGRQVFLTEYFNMPRAWMNDFFRGMLDDFQGRVYQSRKEVETEYYYRVAGVPGLILNHLIGTDAEAPREAALRFAEAAQITNILRDAPT